MKHVLNVISALAQCNNDFLFLWFLFSLRHRSPFLCTTNVSWPPSLRATALPPMDCKFVCMIFFLCLSTVFCVLSCPLHDFASSLHNWRTSICTSILYYWTSISLQYHKSSFPVSDVLYAKMNVFIPLVIILDSFNIILPLGTPSSKDLRTATSCGLKLSLSIVASIRELGLIALGLNSSRSLEEKFFFLGVNWGGWHMRDREVKCSFHHFPGEITPIWMSSLTHFSYKHLSYYVSLPVH